jgi:hypothetical protein
MSEGFFECINTTAKALLGRTATKMRFSKIEVRAEADPITDNNSFYCFRFFFLARGPKNVVGVVRSNFFIGQTKFKIGPKFCYQSKMF